MPRSPTDSRGAGSVPPQGGASRFKSKTFSCRVLRIMLHLWKTIHSSPTEGTRICGVITSFKHKGLQRFYETGNAAGVQTAHQKRLRMQLTALDTAQTIDDMDIPDRKSVV